MRWHLAPLPPGVPYQQQQIEALSLDGGYLDVPEAVLADLATRLAPRMRELLG